MKVLQETPSLCLVQDPFLNSVNSEGLKEAPDPPSPTPPCPPFTSWIMCLYVLLVLQVFGVNIHGGGGGGGWFPVVLIIKMMFYWFAEKMFYCIVSFAYLIFLLSWFSFCHRYSRWRYLIGVQVYSWILSINLAHKCYLYLREYLLLRFIFIVWNEQHTSLLCSNEPFHLHHSGVLPHLPIRGQTEHVQVAPGKVSAFHPITSIRLALEFGL